MHRPFATVFALALVGLFGPACSSEPEFGGHVSALAAEVMAAPESMTIYSLNPAHLSPAQRDARAGAEFFHGFEVTGQAAVEDPEGRRELLRLVEQGMDDSDGTMALCFDPRHGVRIHGLGRSVDLVICYECWQVKVQLDGAPAETVATTDEVEPAISAVFRDRGLSIHP